jgi:hypothetical protein
MSSGLKTTVEVVGPSEAVVVSLNAGPQGPQGEPGPEPVEVVFPIVGGTLGTQPTFTGDPLFTGSYVRSGQLVHFQVQVDFDNITSFGTGQYVIDLPFPSKHAYQFTAGCLHDVSTGKDYPIFAHVVEGQSQLQLQTMDVSGQTTFQVDFTSTVPVTLDVADNFHISGTYIVAGEV